MGLGAENSKLSESAEFLHGQCVGYVDFQNVYLRRIWAAGEGEAFEVADMIYFQKY